MKQLSVKELNIEHLPAVMALQEKIIAGLHADEKHFILKRSVNDFMTALSSENTHMLGVFDGENLVAQSIFSFPRGGQKRDMPEFAGDIDNDKLVVYKAVLVDKDYRGRGLMTHMLDFIEHKARQAGKTTSIIQIAIDNPASWMSAMKHGMSIHKVDYDPDDHAKVLYLQKDFGKSVQTPLYTMGKDAFAMYVGKDIHKEIPALFHKMQYRIAQGYYGVGIDKQSHRMIWVKKHSGLVPMLQKVAHKAYNSVGR